MKPNQEYFASLRMPACNQDLKWFVFCTFDGIILRDGLRTREAAAIALEEVLRDFVPFAVSRTFNGYTLSGWPDGAIIEEGLVSVSEVDQVLNSLILSSGLIEVAR